jgi:hypothetical protein
MSWNMSFSKLRKTWMDFKLPFYIILKFLKSSQVNKMLNEYFRHDKYNIMDDSFFGWGYCKINGRFCSSLTLNLSGGEENVNVIKILELQSQSLVTLDVKNSQNFVVCLYHHWCSVFMLATQKMVRQDWLTTQKNEEYSWSLSSSCRDQSPVKTMFVTNNKLKSLVVCFTI